MNKGFNGFLKWFPLYPSLYLSFIPNIYVSILSSKKKGLGTNFTMKLTKLTNLLTKLTFYVV